MLFILKSKSALFGVVGFFLFSCSSTNVVEHVSVSAASEEAQSMEATLRAYFEPIEAMKDFSGVIRVQRGDELIVETRFGYSNIEDQLLHSDSTRFAAGSITKSMTGALLLSLESAGHLDLASSVSRYVPEYKDGARMTVDQVLRHSAGLPRDVPVSHRETFGEDGIVGWLNRQDLVGEPGANYAYSNVGYELLALICERVANTSYPELVTAHVLNPLGLTDSTVETNRYSEAENIAVGYSAGPAPVDLRPAPVVPIATGAEGLVATAADLIGWMRAIVISEHVNLLDEEASELGLVKTTEYEGRQVYRLQGATRGYGASTLAIPEDDIYVVMAANIEAYPLFGAEPTLLALVYGEKPGPAPLRSETAELSDVHRALIGVYEHPEFGPVQISEQGDGLYITFLEPGWVHYLSPTADGALVLRLLNSRFFRTPDGVAHATQSLIGRKPQIFELVSAESANSE